VVAQEISRLEAAGVIRLTDGQVHLEVHLRSFFGGPLTVAPTESSCRQERKASHV
jgi:hypothetical protein